MDFESRVFTEVRHIDAELIDLGSVVSVVLGGFTVEFR